MDKVQIYYSSLLILSVFLAGLNHGKDGSKNNAQYDFISILVMLPVIGRVFNWW